MATQLIPLFPLSLVLLPSMPLPLHIFEDRYKEMMGEIIPAEGEFGVVLAKDDGIVNIGCTATVKRVMQRYPDGRLDLLAIGQRRFRVTALNEDKAYLRAEVDFFNDNDTAEVSLELRERVMAGYRKLVAKVNEEGDEEREIPDPNFEHSRASFHIGRLMDDADKRQTILAMRSEVERLEYIVRVIPEYLARQERITLAKRVAPLNGHAKAAV